VKLLVIGGSGLIGSHVLTAARQAKHDAVGTFRGHAQPGLVQLDCADSASATALLETEKPDAVIHAAGWTWVDGCEDDRRRAFAENADQPAAIAAQCQRIGCRFAYFSSSYVFDGSAGPYPEGATPNPINVYGESKLRAEQKIIAAHAEALIARVICVYGAEAQGKNFAYQVRRAMEQGQALRLPSDQRGNPTCAGDIAQWLIELLERRASGGVWHLAGPWPDCSRPEWARRLVGAFEAAGVRRHPQFAIEEVPTAELRQRAKRPLHGGLLTPRVDALGLRATDFDKAIAEIVR
jgi:dTDP-4-dehydrorhamnose reductase